MAVDLSEFIMPEKKRLCAVGSALSDLPADDREKLAAALEHPEIRESAIVAWMAKREVKASLASVVHHRRGTCVCSR